MEILAASAYQPDDDAKTFRHNPLSDLVMFLVMAGLLAGGVFAVFQVSADIPRLAWIVVGPMMFFGLLILFVITMAQLGAFRSSLTPDNWFAQVSPSRISFNLRSYRNRHFEADTETVVQFSPSELRSVGLVTEQRIDRHGQKRRTHRTKTIELLLQGDTSALEAACRAERNHEEPKVDKRGKRSNLKHHHVLLFVPKPGVVRVEWNKDLFHALCELSAVAETREVDLDADFEKLPPEEHAIELATRGERFAAMRLLTEELAMDKHAAKQWLKDHAA